MSAPVWVLSVDLQTKTATFQSGMADAARSARGAFTDIKGGSSEMASGMGSSMRSAREGVELLSEQLGVRLPRALTEFLAGLGPVASAIEAAFPFLAVAALAGILIEQLAKMHEAGEKLTTDQMNFGTAVQNAYNALDQKITQAQIRADELKNDHLGALKLQLELINRQSMDELVHAFSEVAKAADVAFGDIKGHWYELGIGSDGAKHALDQFQTQYDSLMAKGNSQGASDLLKGTRESAQHILEMQKQAAANTGGFFSGPKQGADTLAAMRAESELHKAGVGWTEKEVQAQQTLVDALNAQVTLEGKANQLKNIDSGNAKTQVAQEAAQRRSAAEREAAQSQSRMGESAIAADRAIAQSRLAIQHASIAERLQSDLDFADREYAMQQASNQALISALDKSSKDYAAQLQGLHDKELELTQQHATQVTELRSRAASEQAAKALQDQEQSERAAIDATQEGTAARLAAINTAIQQEMALHLQSTDSYKELLHDRIEAAKAEALAEAKLKLDMTDVQAQSILKAAEAEAQAKAKTMQTQGHAQPMHLEEIAQAQKIADMTYEVKRAALQKELLLYQQAGAERAKAAAKTEMQLSLLDKQHTLDSQEQQQQEKASFKASCVQMEQNYAQAFLQVAERHRSLTQTMASLVDQSIQKTLAGVIAESQGQKSEQMAFAKTAAAKAWNAMAGIPIVGPELGAVAAAATFAGAMAFANGGIVPGVGGIDTVPAMLTPGEGVVPKGVMDNLTKMAREGHMNNGGHHYHVVNHFTMHGSALDSDGMDAVMEKHSETISKHIEKTMRKANK